MNPPTQLRFSNLPKNNPLVPPSSPIQVWGKSVKGFMSFDRTLYKHSDRGYNLICIDIDTWQCTLNKFGRKSSQELSVSWTSMPPPLQATTHAHFWVKTSAQSVKLQIILSLSSNLFLQGLEETKTRVCRDTTVVCQTLQKMSDCDIVFIGKLK